MKRSFFLMAGCCVGLSLLGTPLMAEALTGLRLPVGATLPPLPPEPLEQYRQALRDLARERHDPHLSVIEGVPLIPPDLTRFTDGLHPNDHGFHIMAARLAAQWAPMLKLSTP